MKKTHNSKTIKIFIGALPIRPDAGTSVVKIKTQKDTKVEIVSYNHSAYYRLELLACLGILEKLPGNDPVTVYSYAEYFDLVKGMKNIEDQVTNRDLWMRLKKLSKIRTIQFIKADFEEKNIMECLGLAAECVSKPYFLKSARKNIIDICTDKDILIDQMAETDKCLVTLTDSNTPERQKLIKYCVGDPGYQDFSMLRPTFKENDPAEIPLCLFGTSTIVGYLPLDVGQKIAPMMNAGAKFAGRLVKIDLLNDLFELSLELYRFDKLVIGLEENVE